jgi:hypothetical protein
MLHSAIAPARCVPFPNPIANLDPAVYPHLFSSPSILILLIVAQINQERSPLAEFLTRANYGMILGNFELDFNDGEIRYKTLLDATDHLPSHAAIQHLIYTNLMIMDEYLPGIQAVLTDEVSPVEAIRAIEAADHHT